jgi:hypothetical protein
MSKTLKLALMALICYMPCCVSATIAADTDFQDVMSAFIGGGDILSKIIWAACILVGIGMITAAFTQFQIHRRNPKLVPLTTPVMYLILGVCAIAVPFVESDKSFLTPPSTSKLQATDPGQSRVNPHSTDIDAPMN